MAHSTPKSGSFPVVTHVIFDMDGLLLNTEPFYTQVAGNIAARFGRVFDWTLKSRMIGLRAPDSARLFLDTLAIPLSVAEYLEMRREMLEKLFPLAEPLAGARELTAHLKRHGVPIAVASSSDGKYFGLKTSRHREWFATFDCIVLGDDPEVKHGKPAPDVFLAVARRMRVAPSECLVFDDSPAGIEAALAAGMYAVAVPDPNVNPASYAGAHMVLRSLTEFDPAAWGLPAMERRSEEDATIRM
jgi:pseudouridine-5'-monophosphatase